MQFKRDRCGIDDDVVARVEKAILGSAMWKQG